MTKQTAPDPIARSTRDDWLRVALDALVSDGVDAVKVFSLSERLGVSRSSFYWYFRDRKDLLDALVTHWEDTNTAPFLRAASANAPTITASILGVFRLFIDPDLFDPRLDFAMRGWALGDGSVRRALDTADDARLAALAAMFAHHGYPAEEAETRARVLYWMQVGYYSLDLREPLESRLARVPSYLLALTGQAGTIEEITAFTEAARAIRRR